MLTGAVVTIAIALGAALPPTAPEEQVTVVRQLRRSGPAGGSSREAPVVTWLGRDRLRIDDGADRTILVGPGGRARILDHAGRTWREVDLDAPRAPVPGEQPAVAATGETRSIGALPCRGYRLVLPARTGNAAPALVRVSELWASEAAGASPGPRALAALLGVPLIPIDARLAGELGKVGGLPVLQLERTTLLGATEERTTELVAVELRRAPPETWEVPAGYAPAGP